MLFRSRYNVYRLAIDVTLVFAVLDGLAAAGVKFAALHGFLSAYVPFYDIGMGWFVPALAAALLGWIIDALHGAHARDAVTAE